MYHACQVSKITLLFLPPSCSAGNRDNKTHWEFRDFSRPLPGPVTQVAASALWLCLHWLLALALLGSGVQGLAPVFVAIGLLKPRLLSRGWLWGWRDTGEGLLQPVPCSDFPQPRTKALGVSIC